jgi:hypothetical protein
MGAVRWLGAGAKWCVDTDWNQLLQTKYALLRDAFREDLAPAVQLRPTSRYNSWCFEVLQMLRKCVPATAQAVCLAVAEDRWQDVPQIDVASVLSMEGCMWGVAT